MVSSGDAVSAGLVGGGVALVALEFGSNAVQVVPGIPPGAQMVAGLGMAAVGCAWWMIGGSPLK